MLQPLVLWEVIEESVSTLLTAISVLKWDKHGEWESDVNLFS